MPRPIPLSTGFVRGGAGWSDIALSRAPLFALRRLLLGAEQLAVDQDFRDLHRVQRRTLAQIVGDAPERQPVLHRRILADAADVSGVLAGGLVRRDVAARLVLVDDETAGRLAQDVARLVRRDRLLEFD